MQSGVYISFLAQCPCAFLSNSTLRDVHCLLEIGHGRTIYTTEVGTLYKSSLPQAPSWSLTIYQNVNICCQKQQPRANPQNENWGNREPKCISPFPSLFLPDNGQT